MKSSTELIAMAKSIVEREMQRSIERGNQPSFYECIYEAYMEGVEDASDIPSDILQMAQDWHYIEIEGLPPEDDQCQCLCLYDYGKGKSYDTTIGYHKRGKWNLHYTNDYFDKVVAWHKLPDIPEELYKK